ncbi:hypothetical protein [Methyloradius palustris]|uniref:Uncharacterized protein n=1 Tax=Methyloradius palustris TaxID=2778876 RepID=A0A8D5GBD3_9PROT|nr:hypothetical protein [Methyloradius palustris]BCM25156.1 hypothetical protein ZMTM_14150 [Methyloradius palustris]
MENKKELQIDFNEALRRIANTPKAVVSEEALKLTEKQKYNKKEATKKLPLPAKSGD